MERIPVLFDTDIGSDIDDAVCLAYLLAQPRCELVGITTVSGEPIQRAMLADAMCRASGRSDVPIFAGSSDPLFVEQRQKECPQAAVLGDWPHRKDFRPNEAVHAMRECIRSRPGEITLLAVGPLTNVGLLFALDPEIPSLLKELVLMCGAFRPRIAEWNAACDPHAAALVYRARPPRHRSFGLDVTLQCSMEANECRRRFTGGALDVVAQAAEVWFSHRSKIVFHDPLAGAALFEPQLCQYQAGRVTIELQSERLLGLTHFDAKVPDAPHDVASGVDAEAFFAHYFSVVSP